jgi:hypothetical protein
MKQSDIAEKLLENLSKLKTKRVNYDNVNQVIVDFVRPNGGDFITKDTDGARKDRNIFDSTAITAAKNLASIYYSGLTDPSTRWFNLVFSNKELIDNHEAKLWLEEVHRVMFRILTDPESGFDQQNYQFIYDLITFGTAAMWVAEEPAEGLLFQTRHLSEIYIEEDQRGFVDTVYRVFKFNARQAEQKWGEEALGKKMRTALSKDPHKDFEFLHAVMPMKDYERSVGSIEPRLERFDYVSIYVSKEDMNVLSVGGFFNLPYLVSRYDKRTGEIYGIGASWDALSDTQMTNIIKEIFLRGAQKELDPTLLVADDGVLIPERMIPGGMILGALSEDGQPLVTKLDTRVDLTAGLRVLEDSRQDIRSAYFVDAFQPKEGVQPLTATESIHNEQNKLRLVGPQARRFQSEYLTKLVNIVFEYVTRKGLVPPLEIEGEEGKSVDIEVVYVSPLAFTLQTNQLLSYNRFLGGIGPFAEVFPEGFDNFDPDSIFRSGAKQSGIPVTSMRSSDEVEEIRKAREQAAQEAQAQEQALGAADAAAKLQSSGIPVVEE